MDLVTFHTLICILSVFSFLDVTAADIESEMISDQEKALYHLDELQKAVHRLSSLHKRSPRAKRDMSGANARRKSDFMFDSLLDFCLKIQDFTETGGEMNTSVRETDRETDKKSTNQIEPEEDWYEPKVFPTWARASMLGNDRLLLEFQVNHSAPVSMTLTSGLDYDKIDVIKQADHQKVEVETSSSCVNNFEWNSKMSFFTVEQPSSEVILRLDLCYFKESGSKSSKVESDEETSSAKVVAENIQLPRFRIGSNPNTVDDVIVARGKNASFEITAELGEQSMMHFYAIVYDKRGQKYEENFQGLSYDEMKEGNTQEETNLFTVDILKHRNSSRSHAEESEGQSPRMIYTMRFTLNSASGSRTGKLYISNSERIGSYSEKRLVKHVFVNKMIKLRKAGRHHVFPRSHVFISTRPIDLCDQNGNINMEKYGRNCTLTCLVQGRDLRAIYISKKDRQLPIYRTTINKITPDRHLATIDVGMASPEIEGAYECRVEWGRGQMETRAMELVTSGFPKVIETNLTELYNETSLVFCEVGGRKPINITMEIMAYNGTRWPIERFATMQYSKVKINSISRSYEIPTQDLQFPSYHVTCIASSRLGEDRDYIDLPTAMLGYRWN